MAKGSAEQLIELAQDLAAFPPSADFYRTTGQALVDLIPYEQIFWTETDFVHNTARIEGSAEPITADLQWALGHFGPTHPAIQTYMADPRKLMPRRISDVSSPSRWHNTPIYREAFTSFHDAHQLSIVTSVELPGTGSGWTFTRSSSDFSDDEVTLATQLSPMLIAFERRRHHDESPNLTPREREVIGYLASGYTASRIGRYMGVTERTVRKHLGSIYDKLGCNDRLLAVRRALELGLI